jgi:multidrug resistance protein
MMSDISPDVPPARQAQYAPRISVTVVDPSRANRVLGFVFLTVFLDLIGLGIIIPQLPIYVEKMHGTAQTAGFLLSLFAFTQLVATPFLGRLSDKVGRRPVILLSLAGNAASMVLFALALKEGMLWLLFVSRTLAGATAGNLSACQAAIADVMTGDDRARGMGRLGAGIGLGMVIGPVLGSALSTFAAWAPPLAAAALALLDLAFAFFLMPETKQTRADEPAPDRPRPTLWDALRERRMVAVLSMYFATFLYLTNIQLAVPLVASVRFHWTERHVGYVFGGFGLIMLVVQGGLIGRMARAWGPLNIVIGGSLASMIGLVTIAIAQDPFTLIGGLALLGVGLGVVNPCLSTLAANYAGAERQGAILGFAQSAGGLARTVGPSLGGLLYQRLGPGAPFVGGAVAALTALIVAWSLLGVERAQRATSTA